MKSAPALEDIRALAREAHEGQVDPDGMPHIAHCERVAEAFDSDEGKMTALLHDVLEDSELDPDDLRAHGVPNVVVEAVVTLTKRSREQYETYLARVADAPGEAGRLARRAKVADVRDNLDRSERADLADRIAKYRFALDYFTTRSSKCPYCASVELQHEHRDGEVDRRSFGDWIVCTRCKKEWPEPDFFDEL